MTTLSFTITFHGPFHVARGAATAGLDRTVDREVPLPASSIKGVMRAEATGTLGLGDLVSEVFGAPGRQSPWAWSDAQFALKDVGRVARNRIRPGRGGQVMPHHLMLGEHWWARTATFTIEQAGPLDSDDLQRHSLVLRAAAASLMSLGGARNRGEGWVTVTPEGPLTDTDLSKLADLVAGGAS